MKNKILMLIAAFLLASVCLLAQTGTVPAPIYLAFADDSTLTTGDGTSQLYDKDAIFKEGANFVSEITEASRIYNARVGMGVKLGTASKVGDLVFSLANPVTPDSIVVRTAAYSDTEGALVFFGDSVSLYPYGNKVIVPLTKVFDGNTTISEIQLSTPERRAYVIDVTIYPHVEGGTSGGTVDPDPIIPEPQPEDTNYIINGPVIGTMVGGAVMNTGLSSSNTRGGFIARNDGLYFCNYATNKLSVMDLDLTSITEQSDETAGGYYMDQDEAGNIIIFAWTVGSATMAVAQVFDANFNLIRNDTLSLNGRCDMPSVAGNLVSGRGAYFSASNSATTVLRHNYINGMPTSVDAISVPVTIGGNSSVAPLDVDHFYVQSRGNALLYIDCSGETPEVTNIEYFNSNTFTSSYGGKAFRFAGHTLYVMGTYPVGQYGGSFAVYDVTDPNNVYEVTSESSTIGTSTMGTACVTFRVQKEGRVAHIYEYARFHVRKYDLTLSQPMYIRQGGADDGGEWMLMTEQNGLYTYEGVCTSNNICFNQLPQDDGAVCYSYEESFNAGDTVRFMYDPMSQRVMFEVIGQYLPSIVFNVTVPDSTQSCYITGSFNSWTFERMTQVSDNVFTFTYYGFDVTQSDVQYKYLAGSDWNYVEKDASGGEMANRSWQEMDTVFMWAAVPNGNVTISEVINSETGITCTTAGVVTFIRGKNVYIQDETGGILLYFSTTPTILVGDYIVVTGATRLYGGAMELTGVEVVSSEANYPLPDELSVTLTDLINDPLTYYAKRVYIEGVTVASYSSNGDMYVTDGMNTVPCYYVRPDQTALPVGSTVNLHLLGSYYNEPQLIGPIEGIELVVPEETHLYLIGDNQSWDPTNGIEMMQVSNNVYEGTFTFEATSDSYSYAFFAFVTVLADTANAEGWAYVNSHRYGGYEMDQYVQGGSTVNLSMNDFAFKIDAGTYHFRVNLNDMTFHVREVNLNTSMEIFRVSDYIYNAGISSDYYTDVYEGSTLYSCAKFSVTNPFFNSVRSVISNQPNGAHNYIQVGASTIDVQTGIQGDTNPKDNDGSNPANTLIVPSMGSVFQINAAQEGKVLVLCKASSNKQYFVFENNMPLGYSFAMQTYADYPIGDNGLLSYTLVGEEPFNYLSADGLMATTGYNNIRYVETYMYEPGSSEAEALNYKQNGVAVMAFNAHANCQYIVGSAGSKMIVSAIIFISDGIDGTQVVALGDNGYSDVTLMTLSSSVEPIPVEMDTITVRLDPNSVEDWNSVKTYVWRGSTDYYGIRDGWSSGTIIVRGQSAEIDAEGWWSTTFTVRQGTSYHVGWSNEQNNDPSYVLYNQMGSICAEYNANNWNMQLTDCHSLMPDSTNTFTVHVATPGTLSTELWSQISGWSDVMALTVTGTLNDADMAVFNRLIKCQKIDLSGTDITSVVGFREMSKLREVVLPNTLKTIGNHAFYNCPRLATINLDNVEEIGNYAFAYCYGLTDLVLPNVINVGENAFREDEYYFENGGTGGLHTISMPIVQTIGQEAFRCCALLTYVNIPLANEIGYYSFSRCYSLQQIDLSNVTIIGDEAFYMETELWRSNGSLYPSLSRVFLSDELTKIPYKCFSRCPIAEFNFPSALQRIEYEAFNYCVMNDVVLPEGIVYVDGSNFPNANSITIPSSMREFRSMSSNWRTIYCHSVDPNINTSFGGHSSELGNMTLYVPAVSLNAYRAHNNWYYFGQILPLEGDVSVLQIYGDYYLNSLAGVANRADLIINPNGALTLAATDTLHLNNYIQYMGTRTYRTEDWAWDNMTGEEYRKYVIKSELTGSMVVNQQADAEQVEVRLIPVGNRWTFFSLPFDVNMADITIGMFGTEQIGESQWVIREYSGANRAAGTGATWVNVPTDGVLQAYKGYILYWVNDINSNPNANNFRYFRFPAANATRQNVFAVDNVVVPLTEYPAEFSQNSSWNLVGNPYPSLFDIQKMDFGAPITTWNGYNYVAYSLLDDTYNLRPGEAFFVQAPAGEASILFHKEGRNNVLEQELTETEYYGYQAPAPRQTAVSSRRIFNFTLGNADYTDRARLVLNEQASQLYEVNCDAAKMMSTNATVPQLFINENGVRYAIDERPAGNGTYTIGAYFGEDGTYTLHLSTAQADGTQVMLTDTETNQTVNISVGDYTFTAIEGTYPTRFSITMQVTTPTGMNNVDDVAKPYKRIENNHLIIITPNGDKYSVGGQKL